MIGEKAPVDVRVTAPAELGCAIHNESPPVN